MPIVNKKQNNLVKLLKDLNPEELEKEKEYQKKRIVGTKKY